MPDPGTRPLRLQLTILLALLSLAMAGCGPTAVPATPTPSLSPEAAQGKQVFSRHCAACHSLSEEVVIVGPSLAGIATQAGSRLAGQDAYKYILTSILQPGAHLVEGFDDLMPSDYGRKLTGEELDAVVTFLLTQE